MGRGKVGAKQHVHSFLEGKGLCIQQEANVWVGLPKSKGRGGSKEVKVKKIRVK